MSQESNDIQINNAQLLSTKNKLVSVKLTEKNDIKPKNKSSEKNNIKSTIVQKAKSVTKILTTFTVMAAVVVINTFSNATVNFLHIDAGEDYIFYEIETTEYDETKNYIIRLKNDFMEEDQVCESNIFSGSFYDLKPGMKYSLIVICDNNIIGEKNVSTLYSK